MQQILWRSISMCRVRDSGQEFTLVYQEQYGLRLYHRNGLPPLPNRPVSPYLATEHSLCHTMVGSN